MGVCQTAEPDDFLLTGRLLAEAVAGLDPAEMLADMRRHEERNAAQCTALVDWFLDEVAAS